MSAFGAKLTCPCVSPRSGVEGKADSRAKNAQNCFLYRLLLVVVASTFGIQTDEIETEFLYADERRSFHAAKTHKRH